MLQPLKITAPLRARRVGQQLVLRLAAPAQTLVIDLEKNHTFRVLTELNEGQHRLLLQSPTGHNTVLASFPDAGTAASAERAVASALLAPSHRPLWKRLLTVAAMLLTVGLTIILTVGSAGLMMAIQAEQAMRAALQNPAALSGFAGGLGGGLPAPAGGANADALMMQLLQQSIQQGATAAPAGAVPGGLPAGNLPAGVPVPADQALPPQN